MNSVIFLCTIIELEAPNQNTVWFLALHCYITLGLWLVNTDIPHWEELLQSVSDFIFSKHYGYRSRGLRGVKRSEKL